jgi:hypothetical protein
VINLVEDKGKVFEEAYRVLGDGGRLSISDMVSDRPFPMSFRSDAARWAGCVHGALPEQEYLDLVRQAGFTGIKATRSMSGGDVEGVQVYSLSVTATKGQAGAEGIPVVTEGAPAEVIALTPVQAPAQAPGLASAARKGSCCG